MALHRLRDYRFNRTDRVILDTNVLLLVHFGMYSDPYDSRIGPYSKAVSTLIQVEAEIVLLDVVLTEFINASERIAGADWARRSGITANAGESLKLFRQSGERHQVAIRDIEQGVVQLQTKYKSELVSHEPSNAQDLVREMGKTKADLTDVLIARHCIATNACVLTDDGDFQVYATDLDIISNRSAVT